MYPNPKKTSFEDLLSVRFICFTSSRNNGQWGKKWELKERVCCLVRVKKNKKKTSGSRRASRKRERDVRTVGKKRGALKEFLSLPPGLGAVPARSPCLKTLAASSTRVQSSSWLGRGQFSLAPSLSSNRRVLFLHSTAAGTVSILFALELFFPKSPVALSGYFTTSYFEEEDKKENHSNNVVVDGFPRRCRFLLLFAVSGGRSGAARFGIADPHRPVPCPLLGQGK